MLTFLGAHVIPPEFRKRPEAFVDLLVERFIPAVAKARLAEFCDVFCERGAFTLAQSRRILEAGKAHGLIPRIHAEQLTRTGAARLAVAVEAASADHLDQVNRRRYPRPGAHRMSYARFCPAARFHLGLSHYAPARKLIDAGAIVALATDFNPGTSPTVSMPMIFSLACTQMRMTPAEAITAATINPAYSLRIHDRVGSLDVGKYADLAAFDVADYREIPYYFGVNLCSMTMKRGVIIYSRDAKNLNSHEAPGRMRSEFFRRPRSRQDRRHRRGDARSARRLRARPRKRSRPQPQRDYAGGRA